MPDETPEPENPFGADVQDVEDLLPGVRFPEQLGVGQIAISREQVGRFLARASAIVQPRIIGWRNLPTVDGIDLAEVVRDAARQVATTGAAHYAQSALHPNQAGKNSESYASVLWARFQSDLTALEAQVRDLVADVDPNGPALDASHKSAAWSFPDPVFHEHLQH